MAVANSMSAASRSAPSDRPHGTAATARIDALSAIYAAWAAADTDVEDFRKRQLVRRDTGEYLAHVQRRGPHPGYELLAPEQVAAWVKDHYNHTGGEQHIRQLVMDMEVNGPDPIAHLSYVDGRQERRLTVDARGGRRVTGGGIRNMTAPDLGRGKAQVRVSPPSGWPIASAARRGRRRWRARSTLDLDSRPGWFPSRESAGSNHLPFEIKRS
jgi:hypothetical protein